ncbi:phosphotransferase [Streptomyces sp. NPDC097640]|uniref:phosphotransferase family protein n=1 Tax=Streptomyces sp. NPDC097640 TaxID=3157229 RepID=UPI0033170CC4
MHASNRTTATAPTVVNTDTPIHGGYTEPQMQELFEQACAVLGLDATDPVYMRGHTSAVLRLANEPVVLKIARMGTDPSEVQRTVNLVRWLMDLRFPTVALYRPDIQPLILDGHPITLWTYLPQPEHSVSAEAMAKPLRALHSLSRPPVTLDGIDMCAGIRDSLERTTILPEDTIRFLHECVDRLEGALADVSYEFAHGVLQGDPQHANALHSGEGAVLCDWDNAAVGQPEWDLTTVEIQCRRFGYGAQHYQRFADAYGWDVTRLPGHSVLRDLRELRMITTFARKARHQPEKIAEAQSRIYGFRMGDISHRWNTP